MNSPSSTPGDLPSEPASSVNAIENLIATYAELVDDGDFAGVGSLLAEAVFIGAAGTASGGDAVETMLRENVIVYDDGTPRTKHLTTNVIVEVDEDQGTTSAAICEHVFDLELAPSSATEAARPRPGI